MRKQPEIPMHTGMSFPSSPKHSSIPSLNIHKAESLQCPDVTKFQLPLACIHLLFSSASPPRGLLFPSLTSGFSCCSPAVSAGSSSDCLRTPESHILAVNHNSAPADCMDSQALPELPPEACQPARLTQPGKAHSTFFICKDSISGFPECKVYFKKELKIRDN